jgi:hypothetical protein
MIYRFKSVADGDLLMMGPAGDAVLRIIGKEPAAQGIIEAHALGAAIQALEAAVGADEAARKSEAAEPEPDAAEVRDKISLRQRVWPLLEMMRRSQKETADIVWGV